VTRSAASKTAAAADALLAWLRDQPPPVFPPARRGPPDADTAGPPAAPVALDQGADHPPVAPASATPAAPDPVGKAGPDAPLRLAHTDWLHHRLMVTGPDAAMAAFRVAAAGAGVIPWHLDLDRIEEECFHLLVAPPPPQRRSLSLAGARVVATQLRDTVARRHDLAVARVGNSRACPFDLHALVPVPGEILRHGPDDPVSLAWLWAHWGTTRELRHVTPESAAGQDRRGRPTDAGTGCHLTFWSADWSPWRALAQIAARWPALRFDLRPSYDAP
jgi:hypothetical protein